MLSTTISSLSLIGAPTAVLIVVASCSVVAADVQLGPVPFGTMVADVGIKVGFDGVVGTAPVASDAAVVGVEFAVVFGATTIEVDTGVVGVCVDEEVGAAAIMVDDVAAAIVAGVGVAVRVLVGVAVGVCAAAVKADAVVARVGMVVCDGVAPVTAGVQVTVGAGGATVEADVAAGVDVAVGGGAAAVQAGANVVVGTGVAAGVMAILLMGWLFI